MRVRTIVLSLLLLVFCGGIAHARDPDLPKPDPKGVWHYLWDGHSTSTCLGNPKTPVCAIETMIVCHYRTDRKLCETSDYPAAVRRLSSMPMLVPMDLTHHIRFRIGGSVRLRDANLRSSQGYGGELAHAGDLAVEVVQEWCWTTEATDKRCRIYKPHYLEIWIVRRFGKRWAVVSAFPDSERMPAQYLDLIHRK